MTKRTLTYLVAAIAVVAAVTVLLVVSVGDSDSGAGSHTMSNGTMMQDDQMNTTTMDGMDSGN